MVAKTNVAQDITNQTFQVGSFVATGSAGTSTLHRVSGRITTESLATAADTTYTHTLTNTHIAATDIVHVSLSRGTLTTGVPVLATATPANGSVVILIRNVDAAAAFNGTLQIDFWVIKRS